MKYYVIDLDWNQNHNSPWDALWHDPPYDLLDCLNGSLKLAAIWKSPRITLERRDKRPDVYGFNLHHAVTERVRDLWAPIVREEAEFLPLDLPEVGPVYVVHPLWPVDFDARAVVSPIGDRENITRVHKYSFTLDPDEYDGPRHLFRMMQAKGSSARDAGYTMSQLIGSEKIKEIADRAGLRGIAFEYICSA